MHACMGLSKQKLPETAHIELMPQNNQPTTKRYKRNKEQQELGKTTTTTNNKT